MVDYEADAIELVESEFDCWRDRFRAERERIRDALSEAGLADAVVRIEHVGSTAVPDLAAKDVVDVDVVVADDAVGDVAGVIADALGGTLHRNHDGWHPVFRERDGQRFNVHVFARSADGWKTSVATRDVLREHHGLRVDYEREKRALAAETDDVETYSRGKTDVVERIVDRARTDADLAFEFAVPE
ncbi:GrpB family protein [Halorubellus sp. JP-L1]|uniref:GrpB family protein n=1 Tax=Halorubellus sp. JP-L1 TaxID=2715753 RepID=UPI00140C67F6|nr:GrpB family protein [Halorubellus sp. JP-L1]NHN41060.1 GrpB family protein [Halorubellus sp. JP-L1]